MLPRKNHSVNGIPPCGLGHHCTGDCVTVDVCQVTRYRTDFVLKVDDDCYVNIRRMVRRIVYSQHAHTRPCRLRMRQRYSNTRTRACDDTRAHP